MAQSTILNGASFSIPDPGDTGWGAQLTAFLVAISPSVLQKTGGTFTLTAPLDFGPSNGIKALSYSSRTANPATAGILRLAAADTIAFRNNANSANLLLSLNGSDELLFDGSPIGQFISTPNRAVQTDGSGELSVSTVTSTELGYVSGVTSAIQTQLNSKQATLGFTPEDVANKSTNTSLGVSNTLYPTQNAVKTYVDTTVGTGFVHIAGTETITGAKSFSAATLFSDGTAGLPAVSFINDATTGLYKSGTNEASIATNGVQRLQLESDGDIYSKTSGSRLAVKNSFNNINTTSVGALDSATSSDITSQNSKTFTLTFGSAAHVFVIMTGNNDAALVVTNFNTTTITLLGTPGIITATSTPSATQLGIFKSAGQNVISFKSGSLFTSSNSVVRIMSLSGAITASTDWA